MAIKKCAILILLINPIILYTLQDGNTEENNYVVIKYSSNETEEHDPTFNGPFSISSDSEESNSTTSSLSMDAMEALSKELINQNHADDPEEEFPKAIPLSNATKKPQITKEEFIRNILAPDYNVFNYKYKNFALYDKVKSLFKGAYKGIIGGVGLGFGLTALYQAVKNSNSLRRIWVGIGTCYAAAATYFAYSNNFSMFSPTYSNNYRDKKVAQLNKEMNDINKTFKIKKEANKKLKHVIEQITARKVTKKDTDSYWNNEKEYTHYNEQLLNNEQYLKTFTKRWNKKEKSLKKVVDGFALGDDLRWQTRGYYGSLFSSLGLTALCAYCLTHR